MRSTKDDVVFAANTPGGEDSIYYCELGSGGRAVERRTVNRGDGGSIPPTAVSKLRQFCSPHICLCLSEKTLKAGCGPVVDSLILEMDNSRVSPILGCLEETTYKN